MPPKKIDLSQMKKGPKINLLEEKTEKSQTMDEAAAEGEANNSFFSKVKNTLERNRAVQIVFILFGVAAVAAIVFFVTQYFMTGKPKNGETPVTPAAEKKEEGNKPARRTDGVIVESEQEANKYPVAVMIENLSTVRPQSGLSLANIVYETLAEGGITRFMAIFAGEPIKEIRPVRSARPYYLEWSEEYKALYAHAGGSPEALAAISGLGVTNLNGISSDGKYFWRGREGAPHNLYTSSTLLERAVRDKGLKDAKFDSWQFKDEKSLESRAEDVRVAYLNFSAGNYNVKYEYNREENCYRRFHVDTPHTDKVTGRQICPKNVIVQIVPPAKDAGEKGRISLDVTGEGKVTVLRDGEEIAGTWKKENRESRTKFYAEDGKEIELVRGQVWLEILPSDKTFDLK